MSETYDERISAIILTWNNFSDTLECVASLRSGTHPLHRIYVVDNGSSDGTLGLLREEYQHDGLVHVIANEKNLGFALGINRGIRAAARDKADYLIMVNNDATLSPDCIGKLHEAFRTGENIAAVGPAVMYYSEPEKVWQGGGVFSHLKSNVVVPAKNLPYDAIGMEVQDVGFLTGCVLMVRTSVLEAVGGFDPQFYFYSEDADFSLRVLRSGYRLKFVPQARAYHKIRSIRSDRTSAFVMYHLARSSLLLIRKNFSWIYFLYSLILHFVVFTPFRVVQIMTGSRSFNALGAWFRGTFDGITVPLKGVELSGLDESSPAAKQPADRS